MRLCFKQLRAVQILTRANSEDILENIYKLIRKKNYLQLYVVVIAVPSVIYVCVLYLY